MVFFRGCILSLTELWCDGGLHGKNPGALLYGSYKYNNYEKITLNHEITGTSNESEYITLIAGINAVIQEYGCVQDVDLVVRTDSQLVGNQVHGYWNVNAENLKWLCYIAQMLLGNFRSWNIEWTPRNQIVDVLGH